MNRQIVYPGAIPADTDFLNMQRQIMVGLGYLVQVAVGTGGPYAWGLVGTHTTVPSMTINIGPGAISALSTVDASAFGSLASDSNPLMKLGLNEATTQFTLTAPTTSGQSINYLIEATFVETDGNSVVLPYYNASNPSSPYLGPSNTGVAQNTQRLQQCSLQMKAGTAAATGTQTTPAVDSGWIGLYVITVNYGQTSILTSGITAYTPSSFMTTNLSNLNLGLYALLAGSSTQAFSVANATTAHQAVALGQWTSGGSTSITFPAAAATAGTVGSSGWTKDPSGIIRQWGYVQIDCVNTASMTGTSWTFPIAFPTAVLKWHAANSSAAAGQAYAATEASPFMVSISNTAINIGYKGDPTSSDLVCFLIEVEGY